MTKVKCFDAYLVFLFLVTSGTVLAQERPYTEGSVVRMVSIRTETGKFDEYMKYVATTWKAEGEAAKKAGYIVDYQVMRVEPRNENDANLLLVITFKNWAALDGLSEKLDAIDKQVEGSVAAANQASVERGKIRRILGSTTMQILNLK